MLKKIITFLCVVCIFCSSMCTVMAADVTYKLDGTTGITSAIKHDKYAVAIYNDPDGTITYLNTSRLDLYGNGEYGQPTYMGLYSFDMSKIVAPSGKYPIRILFSIVCGNKDFSNNTPIRIYAHEVTGSFDDQGKYSNDTGPKYISVPFAESFINAYDYTRQEHGTTYNQNYYIDITQYYLEALDEEKTTLDFAISCKAESEDSSFNVNQAGSRIFVEYANSEQELNFAPAIENIVLSDEEVGLGESVTVSAKVTDADEDTISSVYFKVAGTEYEAEQDESDKTKYTATVTPPEEFGTYDVDVVAIDSKGHKNTEVSTVTVKNNPPVIECGLLDGTVLPAFEEKKFEITVTDSDSAIKTVEVFFDDKDESLTIADNKVTIPASYLTKGSHSLVIKAEDAYGATAEKTVEFETDYVLVSNIVQSTEIVAGQTITATMDIKNIYNANKKMTAIYGLYDNNGTLIAIDVAGKEFGANETLSSVTLNISVPDDAVVSNLHTELYVWETGGAFRPLIPVK